MMEMEKIKTIIKREAAAMLLIGIFCACNLCACSKTEAEHVLHVDAAGKGIQDGSPAHPYKTIQQAAAIALPGDTVAIHTGTYRETVKPANSGAAGKPIVYQPNGKAMVVVDGAALIGGKWTSAGKGLFVTDWPGDYISANNQSDAVFVDGKMVDLARWPEETNHNLSRPKQGIIAYNTLSVKTNLKSPGPEYEIFDTTFFDPDFDQPDGRWKGARVWLCNGGATDTQDGDGVTGTVLDTSQALHTITIRASVSGPIGKANLDSSKDYQIGTGSHYYLFDPVSPEGLLYNAQFWHDRAKKLLYIRTADGSDPAKHRVEVKQRDYGFLLDPDGKGRSYLTLKGIDLFACSITTDRDLGNGIGNGGNRKGTGPSHDIVLDGLRAQYVTHFTDQSGNLQTQWGQSSGIIVSGTDCEIRSSTVAWSSGCGIVVTGRRCRAVNNLVHDVVYAATDCGGISTGAQYGGSDSFDNEIGYNTVYNVGIDGIEINSLTNLSPNRPGVARIHHNIIHDAVLQVADSAAIHEVGHDGQWVRIDHNVIYNMGSIPNGYLYSGIYLDYAPNDGNSPGRYILDHNVIYNVSLPIEINHPNGLLVVNNTLIDIAKHGPIQSNGGSFENTIIRNNLSNNPYSGVPPAATSDHNITNASDSYFVNSAADDPGKRSYELTETGVQKTGKGIATFVGATPPTGIGAYAVGVPRWRAGCDLEGVIPIEAAPPPLLPDKFKSGENVFPQGDFDHIDPVLSTVGWSWTQYGNVSVRTDPTGNRYLHIGRELKDRTVQAFARLTLSPVWKRLRVSARLRVQNLIVSPSGLTASIITRIMDKDDKLLAYAPKLELITDTDWKTLTAEFTVPAGADHLNIEVSSIGTQGDFDADDIAYIPIL